MRIHPSLTVSKIAASVKRSMRDETYPGFCIVCGRKAPYHCEPDLTEGPCTSRQCQGAFTVHGAEDILSRIVA